mmetsp:Transcript_15809/g.29206  ORF Transcript_15809/g.29206 Transcript_15809/m.29206 type:complete len:268 (+) Transcript_15809:487-1290(+)
MRVFDGFWPLGILSEQFQATLGQERILRLQTYFCHEGLQLHWGAKRWPVAWHLLVPNLTDLGIEDDGNTQPLADRSCCLYAPYVRRTYHASETLPCGQLREFARHFLSQLQASLTERRVEDPHASLFVSFIYMVQTFAVTKHDDVLVERLWLLLFLLPLCQPAAWTADFLLLAIRLRCTSCRDCCGASTIQRASRRVGGNVLTEGQAPTHIRPRRRRSHGVWCPTGRWQFFSTRGNRRGLRPVQGLGWLHRGREALGHEQFRLEPHT